VLEHSSQPISYAAGSGASDTLQPRSAESSGEWPNTSRGGAKLDSTLLMERM